jgi:hypothetical protein
MAIRQIYIPFLGAILIGTLLPAADPAKAQNAGPVQSWRLPQTKQVSTLVYTYRNQLFESRNDPDFDAEGNPFFTGSWGTGPTLGCPQCTEDPLHLTFAGVKAGTDVPGNSAPDGIHYDVHGNLRAQLSVVRQKTGA